MIVKDSPEKFKNGVNSLEIESIFRKYGVNVTGAHECDLKKLKEIESNSKNKILLIQKINGTTHCVRFSKIMPNKTGIEVMDPKTGQMVTYSPATHLCIVFFSKK